MGRKKKWFYYIEGLGRRLGSKDKMWGDDPADFMIFWPAEKARVVKEKQD